MNVTSTPKQLGIYWLLGILACGLAIAGKLVAVWSIDTYVYSLPIVGGVLASLEIVEIASPILLALLGLILGSLTYYLSPNMGMGLRFLLLGLTFPLILIIGYPIRHNLWVQQVGSQANLSFDQARQATDAFLQQKTSKSGSVGFYWYTATQSKPPVRLENVETLSEDNSLQNQLTELGKRQTGLWGLAFSLYNWLFNHAGWGLRAAYALLSGFLGLFYFYKGQRWATVKRQRQR